MNKNQQSSTTNRTVKSQSKSVSKKMDYSCNNSNMCNYTHRICLRNKLEGSDYCIRHILHDKNAQFKQCSFVHPHSHKRCSNAARKTERKDSYCVWHLKKIFIKRKQLQNSNEEKSMNKISTIQQLFRDLEHYCPNEEHDKNRLNSNWIKQDDDSVTASDNLRRKIMESKLHAENTDEDEDLVDPLVENTFRTDIIDSDSESIDSDQEEPLKHAGIYTPEEVSAILRDKMIKLQSLYVDEISYLQFLLKDKYKKYINTVRNQQDVFQYSPFKISINGNLPSDDYNKLKTMMRYHRYHGSEILLRMQVRDKKYKLEQEEKQQQNQQQPNTSQSSSNLAMIDHTSTSINYKPKPIQFCIYKKDDEKCERRAMPLTHYCKIHILYDMDQVLFRPCASGDPPCLKPVMSYQKGNTCILHEEQKEIKDFCVLEEDENTNFKTDEPVSNDNFLNDEETGTLELDAGTLFGFDQLNQLESNQ